LAREHTIELLVCEPHVDNETVARISGGIPVVLADGLRDADIIVGLVKHTAFLSLDYASVTHKVILDFCGLWHTKERAVQEEYYYWPHHNPTIPSLVD
jgi:UDP-N-acetyl-D-mannosaminuronate dehydrogenase